MFFLWLMNHNALPTSHLVRNRVNKNLINDVCLWCLNSVDNQDHILWDCEPAKWGWSFIEKWWEAKITLHNLWSSFSKFKSPIVKNAWGVVVASTLWTVWLVRNRCVFEGKKPTKRNWRT